MEVTDGPEPTLCALEGCDLPVPARSLDEQGRRRGGRPARFCSKAHADAASRARRAQELATVDDPLLQIRVLGQEFLPAATELAAVLREMVTRYEQADQAALARVAAAEQLAEQARAEAESAVTAAETAETGRREAVAQARADRVARDQAAREAERVTAEAQETRRLAWEQVAVHERVRGQAEAARQAAQEGAARLAAELREATEAREAMRTDLANRAADLAATRQELTRVEAWTRTQQVVAEGRIDALEQSRVAALEEIERLRAERTGLNTQMVELTDRLAACGDHLAQERAGHVLARERLSDARQALARAESIGDDDDGGSAADPSGSELGEVHGSQHEPTTDHQPPPHGITA